MGQDALTPSEYTDRQVRDQLHEGFRLARELDERVRSIPTGKLCVGSDQSEAAASSSATTQLRCADVVAAFNKAVQLLLQSSYCSWDQPTALSAASSPLQTTLYSSPQQKPTNSCLPSVRAINLAADHTKSPPLSPAGKHLTAPSAPHRAAHGKQPPNMASASASPSPSTGIIHSPLFSATSEMSDGSPKPDLPADEATTAMKAVICRKRKLQPKVALRMPAGSAETAEGNARPDDGHTWREYGQKNILGSQYPRSYYRCTHKTDTGCPALKQVQRCDEDEASFDVVYKGYHTCRSAELDKECWPLAFPQGLSTLLHFPSTSTPTLIPPAAASLMLANMSAAQQSGPAGVRLPHHANLDNLLPHQLCHVVSVASSDALPLSCNADHLSALTGSCSANKLSAGAERNSVSFMNPALQPYQINSGQAMMNGGSDHVHPLFSNSSAAIQDGSARSVLRGTGHALHGKGALSCEYTREQEQAVNPLEDWPEFENNSEDVYKRFASYNIELATPHVHHDQLSRLPQPFTSLLLQSKPVSCTDHITRQEQMLSPPSPNCSSLQGQDDVASSALAFNDGMDNDDDDLLGYLDP